MSTTQLPKSHNVGSIFARLLHGEGALRNLSARSGISIVTLRTIATTGSINSYVTALALERATDGEIKADEVTSIQTRGADLYRREPARTLLNMSFERDVSIARLLGRHGLTPGELWNFMNAPEGKYQATKEKVKAVLVDQSPPSGPVCLLVEYAHCRHIRMEV